MNAIDHLDIMRDAVWVMLKLGAPSMAAALFIGLLISIIQALTQIQEATLTFVPKMLGVFAVLILTMSWSVHALQSFTHTLFSRIAGIGPV